MGEKVNIVAESFVRAAASFGVAAASISVVYMMLAGASPTSDDPYVLGVAVGAIVGAVLFIALVCEQFLGKKTGRWIYGGLYGLFSLYTWYVFTHAELFGPGLALLIFGGAVVFALLEFSLLRQIRLLYYGSVGSALAVITLALLLTTQR